MMQNLGNVSFSINCANRLCRCCCPIISYFLPTIKFLVATLVEILNFPIKILDDGGYPFIKALKREIIGDIRFDEELRVCEDEHFFINVLSHRKNLAFCFYVWMVNNNIH